MTRKSIAVLLAAVLSITMLTACGAQKDAENSSAPGATEPAEQPSAPEQPTKDNPIVVDKEGRKVLVYAEVNRKYVTEATRHGVVCADGSNADKAVFKAGGNALDFHKALADLGAKPGDNVKPTSPSGTAAAGDGLDISVSWEDQSFPIGDLIVSSGELGGKALEPKFGGNYDFQAEKKTGCIFCLDSCAAGITSNAAVGWKSFDEKKVEFRGDGDKLPADGAPVVVTFALQ